MAAADDTALAHMRRFPVATSEGSHPFPSRSRKLSPPEPMVLHGFRGLPRSLEQPGKVFLPSRRTRVRAMSSGLRADRQDNRLAPLHAPDLPLQNPQLGRVYLVVRGIDRRYRRLVLLLIRLRVVVPRAVKGVLEFVRILHRQPFRLPLLYMLVGCIA